MTTPADIERWKALLPSDKQGEVKVRSAEEMGQPFMYHVSMDHVLRTMTPSVTRRTLSAEDRAIPRISVAPTLAGCILAYQSCGYDFESDAYNGWYVYGLPYQHAVRPSKALLPDVEITDEHWLVTFDPDTVVYKPRPIAKFFIERIHTTRRLRKVLTTFTGYIDVIDVGGLVVAEGKVLKPGRYSLSWNREDLVNYKAADHFQFDRVSSTEYKTIRDSTVSLLSIDQLRRPGSAYW